MSEVASWLGPAASIITAVGALPLAGLAQSRGETRVRNSIANSLKTIKELDELKLSDDLALRKSLQDCLSSDLSALDRIVQARNEKKERNVASLAIAIVFCAALTVPLWLMWEPQTWWTWIIFVTVAVVAALLLLGGVLAWRQPPNKK